MAQQDMQLAASTAFLQILQDKLVPLQNYTQTFLQTILTSVDSKDSGDLTHIPLLGPPQRGSAERQGQKFSASFTCRVGVITADTSCCGLGFLLTFHFM